MSPEPTTAEERREHLRNLEALDAHDGGVSTLAREFTRRLIADLTSAEARVKELSEGMTESASLLHGAWAFVTIDELGRAHPLTVWKGDRKRWLKKYQEFDELRAALIAAPDAPQQPPKHD